jgi:hypothetical protein
MPRRANPFQNLSAAIMTVFYEPEYAVEESVLEQHPRTGVVRELDIRITSRSNPKDRMLVECRAHQRPQDILWIDALDGKARSLGFQKTVAISASGFTKGALVEARDRGIETLHLKQAEQTDWRNWKMSIKELGVYVEGPVLRSVDFGVDATWLGTLPDSINISQVILVDTRDKTKIPLLQWVAGLLTDPEQAAELQALARKGNLNDLRKTHPCAPGMGFIVQGREKEFIPLVELTVHVDYVFSHDSIPLEHLDVGGQRILKGESQVRGVPRRVILHEKDNGLRVLVEHEPPWSQA